MAYNEKKLDDGETNVYMGTPPHQQPTNGHPDVENGTHADGYDHPVFVENPGAPNGGVQRHLKQRHMAMIALGGAIGTGLFIGSGSALASGGPVGCWLGYIIMAGLVYCMMIALGEMATLYPVAGGFSHYASRFVDPSVGFALGFNYWYSYAITIPTEIVAGAIVISYWDDTTNAAVFITVQLILIWAINLLGARAYGEAEFWFSSIKVVTIVGLIILGIVLMCGGGPNHDAIGFRYWRNPGPFNHIATANGPIPGAWGEFLAFWNVFVQAAFSFIGTEIIATTLGEAQNPRKVVPKAISRVFWRLLFFYVGGIFVISVLVPYTEPLLLNGVGAGTATASPFVIAIKSAGIKGLPSVANAVFLISAWSAGNSDLYASSRTLYALAIAGQMPKFLTKCTRHGLPIWCVVITGIFGVLGYLNQGGATAQTAFNWLYNLSAITGIITWWCILLSYLRFYYGLKKQGLSRDQFPYRAPFQPYASWFGFIFFTLIILFNGFTVFLAGEWNTSKFFAAYITLPIFFICWIGWKIYFKSKVVPLDQIDFMSGRKELDEMEERDAEMYKPQGMFEKIMSILF